MSKESQRMAREFAWKIISQREPGDLQPRHPRCLIEKVLCLQTIAFFLITRSSIRRLRKHTNQHHGMSTMSSLPFFGFKQLKLKTNFFFDQKQLNNCRHSFGQQRINECLSDGCMRYLWPQFQFAQLFSAYFQEKTSFYDLKLTLLEPPSSTAGDRTTRNPFLYAQRSLQILYRSTNNAQVFFHLETSYTWLLFLPHFIVFFSAWLLFSSNIKRTLLNWNSSAIKLP